MLRHKGLFMHLLNYGIREWIRCGGGGAKKARGNKDIGLCVACQSCRLVLEHIFTYQARTKANMLRFGLLFSENHKVPSIRVCGKFIIDRLPGTRVAL